MKDDPGLVGALPGLRTVAAGDTVPEAVLHAVMGRIEAPSSGHPNLRQSAEVRRFEAGADVRSVRTDPIDPSGRDDAGFGLPIDELLTSAVEHGFADGRPGPPEAGLRREGGDVAASVAEDGPGSDATGMEGRTLDTMRCGDRRTGLAGRPDGRAPRRERGRRAVLRLAPAHEEARMPSDERSLRVLVVEDEALLVMDIEQIIEGAGHRMVADVPSVPRLTRLPPELTPDLAFVDLHLAGGSSGLDAAAWIRKAWPEALIVFVTANARQLLPDIPSGDAVLSKPYTECGMAGVLSFLGQGLSDPPPNRPPPPDFVTTPRLRRRLGIG